MLTPNLIIFAKAPVAGRVKTRMQPVLNPQQAARLHERLVLHCLRRTQGNWNRQLWCSPDCEHEFFQSCRQEFQLDLQCQQGDQLGTRMANAVKSSLEASRQAVVIGTDCPALDSDYIQSAFDYLQDHHIVIGPAKDGGYVLLGMNRYEESLFHGIEWGTGKVLADTLKRIEWAGLSYRLLPVLEDIDRPQDLSQLEGVISWI